MLWELFFLLIFCTTLCSASSYLDFSLAFQLESTSWVELPQKFLFEYGSYLVKCHVSLSRQYMQGPVI